MTISITVPDKNDSLSRVTLGEEEYLIRFTWNNRGQFWSFGLYDMEENPILTAKKIVPFAPLNHFYTSKKFPKGIFGCITTNERVLRKDFVNDVAKFIFIPNDDIDGWEASDAYE